MLFDFFFFKPPVLGQFKNIKIEKYPPSWISPFGKTYKTIKAIASNY